MRQIARIRSQVRMTSYMTWYRRTRNSWRAYGWKECGLRNAVKSGYSQSFALSASFDLCSSIAVLSFLVSAGNETSSRQHSGWGQWAANGPRCRVMPCTTRHRAPGHPRRAGRFSFPHRSFPFFCGAWEMNFPDDSDVLGGPAVWRRRVASACIRPKTAYCSEVTNRFCKTQTCRLWKINFFKVNLYISSIEVLHNKLRKNASYCRCFAIFLQSFLWFKELI